MYSGPYSIFKFNTVREDDSNCYPHTVINQRKSLAPISLHNGLKDADDEIRRHSLATDQSYTPKRRQTFAEIYIETRRSGSLAIPIKFYTELQRKGEYK